MRVTLGSPGLGSDLQSSPDCLSLYTTTFWRLGIIMRQIQPALTLKDLGIVLSQSAVVWKVAQDSCGRQKEEYSVHLGVTGEPFQKSVDHSFILSIQGERLRLLRVTQVRVPLARPEGCLLFSYFCF